MGKETSIMSYVLRRTSTLLGILLLLVTPSIAYYVPPDFHELIGLADLIVVGEVVSVADATFTLRVDDVLVGETSAKHLQIIQYHDWTCSSRWKPYAAGQKEIAFLVSVQQDPEFGPNAVYRTMSAGDEGEWEIVDDQVSAQGFRIPGYVEHNEGEHPGQWLPLALVLDAIRSYRTCFSVHEVSSSSWDPKNISVTCTPEQIKVFSERSVIHHYLAESSMAEKYRYEGSQ